MIYESFMCRHTETEAADQTCYFSLSKNTDNGHTSPSTDPVMPGIWRGSHENTTGMTQMKTAGNDTWIFLLEADALPLTEAVYDLKNLTVCEGTLILSGL